MLAGTALSLMSTVAEASDNPQPGLLGWLSIPVVLVPNIIVALWNRSGSGPGPVVSAAISGAFLAIGAVMVLADVGAGEFISRNPLVLLAFVGVWLVGTLSIYMSLRRQNQDRR